MEPKELRGVTYYVSTIRAPHQRYRAALSQREVGLRESDDPRDPDSYDQATKALLKFAQEEAQERGKDLPVETGAFGRIIIRRVFQSTCPV